MSLLEQVAEYKSFSGPVGQFASDLYQTLNKLNEGTLNKGAALIQLQALKNKHHELLRYKDFSKHDLFLNFIAQAEQSIKV